MNIQKELQNRIGELIGKDYFKLEKGQVIKLKDGIYDESSGGMFLFTTILDIVDDLIYVDGVRFILTRKKEDIYEIIGQEPSLNDVLMALEENKGGSSLSYCMYSNGEISVIDYGENGDESMTIKYDLSKFLFQQSPETLKALLELLN